MLTRCPQCVTRFRVRPEHLQAAAGKVRCGRCGSVFDALRHAEPDTGDAEPVTEPAPDHARTPPPAQPADTHLDTHSYDAPGTPRPWAPMLWGIGLMLLSIALGAQLMWWERDRVALHPRGLQALEWLCRHVPCDIQPPRAPETIEVLARALEPDPERQGVLKFRLTMVNRGPAQPFPILELSLFDQQERLVGIRRFSPEDYRESPQGLDVMPPERPTEVLMDLADPGAQVVGFQIDFL